MTAPLRTRAPAEIRFADSATPSPLRVALVGNPNCGKSTLFNALTGLRQRVANFPGVTVERLEGSYGSANGRVAVTDLPGIYGLSPQSPDETIAVDVLRGRARGVPRADVIVLVLDAEQLDRSLYLATQVLELGIPTVVALNRMDRANAANVRIDVPELIHELGAVVVPIVASRGEGIDHLRRVIDRAVSLPPSGVRFDGRRAAHPEADDGAEHATMRHRWIAGVVERTVTRPRGTGPSFSDRADRIALHGVWGPVVFLALMAAMFQAMFAWAKPLADGIQLAVTWTAAAIGAALPPGELRSLLVGGALGGVGSVLVFLPQIALLFLFIGLLEDCGYMARAAFVMDRFMRPLGLHGRSFIPLISGYACAVPAILATRTIQHPRERLATIMVTPLISCSARLPVYALLIGAFVPATRYGPFSLHGLTLLGMYLLGTVAALASAALFRRTLLRSETRALIIELPPYSVPNHRVLAASVWQRVRVFLRRAGTVIFAVSIVLWALANYPRATGTVSHEQQLAQSALGRVGHVIEPAVRPLGYDWKIGVSMISSFAAREVFVSTMATIYGADADGAGPQVTLAERLRAERDDAGRPRYSTLVAVGLMAFYVFALMCTSTLAVTTRESAGGWRGVGWAAFQFGYMLALAYAAALVIYRGGMALGLGGG